jgi:acyl carrier protein phosphodiesterase
MNFLAHLYLSGDDPELLVGNLMGDFVKGRLEGRFPPGIERGIALHRRIDSFAAGNHNFLLSKRRIEPSFGLYRAVLVDLYYDHFLAIDWNEYAEVAFPRFVANAYGLVSANSGTLPERLRRIVPLLFEEWLPSYREIAGIELALGRMSARLVRPNPLGEGGAELRRNYRELHEDFRGFFPELQRLAGMGKG